MTPDADTRPQSSVRQVPRDFVLLLPPGWTRVPLDERTTERMVRLVGAQVDGLPGERREALRQQLTRLVADAVRTAEDAGGTDLFVCLQRVQNTILPATGMVAHRVASGGVDALMDELAREPGDATVISLAGARGVRLVSTSPVDNREAEVTALLAQHGTVDVPDLVRGLATYVLDLPGTDGRLVFSWSVTERDEVVEATFGLFDAVMESLRWTW